MTDKKGGPRVERSQFVNDAILRETVKMENKYHKDFVEFHPSLNALNEPTPDKPGIKSFCSEPHNEDDEMDEEMMTTLGIHTRSIDDNPHSKYRTPMTTSMEIGWDATEYGQFKSMFDHRIKKTDVTQNPSKWDPNANPVLRKDAK